MKRSQPGMPGHGMRGKQATSWHQLASRTQAEVIAYSRIDSLRAEADNARLARLVQRRGSERRGGLRLQIGIALARIARAVAEDSIAATRPTATATPTSTTPCP